MKTTVMVMILMLAGVAHAERDMAPISPDRFPVYIKSLNQVMNTSPKRFSCDGDAINNGGSTISDVSSSAFTSLLITGATEGEETTDNGQPYLILKFPSTSSKTDSGGTLVQKAETEIYLSDDHSAITAFTYKIVSVATEPTFNGDLANPQYPVTTTEKVSVSHCTDDANKPAQKNDLL